MQSLRNLKQERGASIVEYGLVVALIAIVSLTSISALGNSTSGSLTASAGTLSHEENADSDTTTTTEPASDSSTTTTTTEPTTTTTSAAEYPTAVAGVKGKVTVTYGYVDEKVVVVDTQTEGEWSVKVTTETSDRIDLEFTNKKTGSVVTTEGFVKKGELETKTKEKAK